MNKQNIFEGRRKIFTFSPRPLNILLAILKSILELKKLANRNQEFIQWTNRKRRGPQRSLADVSPSNVISPICFHLNREGNGNDDNFFKIRKIWNFLKFFENWKWKSRGPVPLRQSKKYLYLWPAVGSKMAADDCELLCVT